MGKSTPKPPAPPDYAAAAQQQGVANLAAGEQGSSLSNPNIISPYGNQTVTWANTGINNNPQGTVTQTLTPEAQATLNAQQQVQHGLADVAQQGIGQAQGILNTPFNPDLPRLQTSLGQPGPMQGAPGQTALNYGADPSQFNARGTADTSNVAAMPINAGTTAQQAIMARLQPQLQQNENANYQRLANQGITQGSEAWANAMRDQGQQRNDLESQAALQGIGLDMNANQQGYGQAVNNLGLYNQAQGQNFNQAQGAAGLFNQAAGQAYGQGLSGAQLNNQNQNQAFNQNLGAAQFGNTALQNSLNQQLTLRNQPINEIGALMSGSQIQNPQFQQYTGQNVAAAPVFQATQAAGQNAMDLYGIRANQAASNSAGLGNLLGTGASLLAMSDERLKSNIVRIGDHPLGIGVYEYDIFGRREIGVMAQELLRVKPEAVRVHPSGFLMVDYGALQ